MEYFPDSKPYHLTINKKVTEYIISTPELKAFAKRIFKDIDLLPNGFSIECVTVIFHKTTMQVSDFDAYNNFKLTEAQFLWPESGVDMVKKLRFHCGQEKIDQQIKTNITIP